MVSEEKLSEARAAAKQILGLSAEDVSRLYFREMKRRKLGRLVHLLDRLIVQDGESDDRRVAVAALERLGFPVANCDR